LKRIHPAWYTTYQYGTLVTVFEHRKPYAPMERLARNTVKRIARGCRNWNLTDALEQQRPGWFRSAPSAGRKWPQLGGKLGPKSGRNNADIGMPLM
jgi:hypothetical protein